MITTRFILALLLLTVTCSDKSFSLRIWQPVEFDLLNSDLIVRGKITRQITERTCERTTIKVSEVLFGERAPQEITFLTAGGSGMWVEDVVTIPKVGEREIIVCANKGDYKEASVNQVYVIEENICFSAYYWSNTRSNDVYSRFMDYLRKADERPSNRFVFSGKMVDIDSKWLNGKRTNDLIIEIYDQFRGEAFGQRVTISIPDTQLTDRKLLNPKDLRSLTDNPDRIFSVEKTEEGYKLSDPKAIFFYYDVSPIIWGSFDRFRRYLKRCMGQNTAMKELIRKADLIVVGKMIPRELSTYRSYPESLTFEVYNVLKGDYNYGSISALLFPIELVDSRKMIPQNQLIKVPDVHHDDLVLVYLSKAGEHFTLTDPEMGIVRIDSGYLATYHAPGQKYRAMSIEVFRSVVKATCR